MSRPRHTSHLPLLALAAVLVALLGPGTAFGASATTSVVDGEQAARGSFPYLAFVYFREGASSEACTGTVVSSNVILTAAHCVVDEEHGTLRSPAGFRVITGNVEWGASERVVSTISSLAVHPDYAWSGDYAHWADAAVLELSQPIAAPAVRLASSEAWSTGDPALIAGWGKESPAASGPAAVLHYGTTAIQPADYCGDQASHFHADGQLCVLDPGGQRSACSGDSGGPLLVVGPGSSGEPLEIGIASFAVGSDCAAASPQYYTRADLISPWVAEQVALVAPPPGASIQVAALPATLTRLGAAAAKGYVRTALAQALGARFEHRTAYRVSCEAIEAARRACAVGWGNGPYLYSGWVTVYHALEANQVVWRYGYKVTRTVAGCRGHGCASHSFHGRSATAMPAKA